MLRDAHRGSFKRSFTMSNAQSVFGGIVWAAIAGILMFQAVAPERIGTAAPKYQLASGAVPTAQS
jgi:hypothetical protein